ncbi:MAG TPA: hypothetical protein DCY88_17235 [Cyanobacteria bacterium UBA11372]|nr:hypothetical protein [Cyanobacteria bacterium UBA11372]
MISFAVASKLTADPKTKLVQIETEEPQDRYFSQYSNLAVKRPTHKGMGLVTSRQNQPKHKAY